MANTKLSMKLLIDSRGKRVLFAEAGKECVDFLFYLLSLPVATIIRLLKEEGMAGSLPKLYKSLEKLNSTYIEADKNKEAYLKPVAPVSSPSAPLLAIEEGANDSYKCNYCSQSKFLSQGSNPFSQGFQSNPFSQGSNPFSQGNYVSDKPGKCQRCRNQMVKIASNVKVEVGGLVKGMVTYMVMDDLEVKPMSTISSIALLNTFNVKDVGALEEKVVTLGMKEALKLLKLSLESNKVLTDLFC